MNISILSFSRKGEALGKRILEYFIGCGDTAFSSRCGEGELGEWTRAQFENRDALIFIGACGIAVRAVAPYVKSKASDPAILVIDDGGRYVIPLLSGHLGGANALAGRIADALEMTAVITTATDAGHVFAFDSWATENGMTVADPHRIKKVSAALLAGKTVTLMSDFPVEGTLPDGVVLTDRKDCDVRISWRELPEFRGLQIIPKVVSLGLGCRRDTPEENLRAISEAVLKAACCSKDALKDVASIDLKKNEAGILAYCKSKGFPFRVFSAKELCEARGDFTASEFVEKQVGVDNVCERSACLASGGGTLIVRKTIAEGATAALALSPFVISFSKGCSRKKGNL